MVWSSPAVAEGLVYIGSADKNLYALDAQTGELKWKYTTGNAIHSSPALANGVVFIGSDDGKLYALDSKTGTPKWSSALSDVAFFASPMLANNLVYLSSNSHTLAIYNASAREKSQSTICRPLKTLSVLGGPILSSATVVDGAVYLSSQDGHLYAFHL